ncbi:MAG: glycosyl hydrolase, partial [Terriglobia bacterium]
VQGPSIFQGKLPVPEPRKPYFDTFPSSLNESRAAFYRDVAILAVPTPIDEQRVLDIDEKALYYRAPFSSVSGVKPYLPAPAHYPELPAGAVIPVDKVVDLTNRMNPDGFLSWQVPPGHWTILRFGSRNNGANSRPAPIPGLGFECDKFDAAALDAHFQEYIAKLLNRVGKRKEGVGLTMLHMDSWEVGAQNWSSHFREEFRARRGYDPLPYYPVYTGRVIGSLEISERFLWDLRLTAQELVIQNHAERLKELGRRHGLGLSIEPYDMNPTADLVLGMPADIPMCEFWSLDFGFDTSYSCIEATSIAHILGRPVVGAEAFTAIPSEALKQYPGSMKNQGDWAFCAGVNRFVFHTFAHQPLGSERPGMTMGPFGVHWDRNQTWWPMVSEYHRYISRCSYFLRQGITVADILYLSPEGAPHVFRPPSSSLTSPTPLPDRRGYNFDSCAPGALVSFAEVHDGPDCFPRRKRLPPPHPACIRNHDTCSFGQDHLSG